MGRAMAREYVQAEVGRGVAPDGVCVVAVALRVVPLDQQPRSLQPVVVRGAGLGRPRPGEVHRVEDRLVPVAVPAARRRRAPGRGRCSSSARSSSRCSASSSAAATPFGVVVYGERLVVGVGIARGAASIASLSACSFSCSTGIGEALVPPDAGQRNQPVAVGDRTSGWRSRSPRAPGPAAGPAPRRRRAATAPGPGPGPRPGRAGGSPLPPGAARPPDPRPGSRAWSTTSTPSTTRLFSETWCPPNRQPHAPAPPARRTPAGSTVQGRGRVPGRSGPRTPRCSRARSPGP